MSFEKIIGNDKVKTFLNKQIEDKHILHSYLFIGIDGIGKTLFAKEFARKILCLNQEIEQDCLSCTKWNSNNHPDYLEINPENDVIKIDQIRNMQEKISEKPITSKRKVYIITDSDLMTDQAQNCLLKTLEEPPEYATIILIASNESKLLNTIKSRCIKVIFEGIQENLIQNKVREILNIEPIEEFIKKSEGSIRKALTLHEQKEIYEKVSDLINNLERQDLITIFNKAEILYKEKEKIQQILEYINISLYHTKELKKINCIKHIEEVKKRLSANSNYDMCIDYLLIKIWEEINEKYSRG